jgi:F0F1-type ATP synthase membrane subunit b/b'
MMDAVVAIFSQLGVNESVIIQFVVFIAFFILMKVTFLNKLQEVIFKREENTVKLAGDSELKLEEIKRLSEIYTQKLLEKNKEQKSKTDTKKQEIVKEEEKKYKEEETTQNSILEDERKKMEVELKSQKDEVLSNTGELAKALVTKVTKG